MPKRSDDTDFDPERDPADALQADGTLDSSWRDYATACTILENIEMMIDLADQANLSDEARTILQRARIEAQRVIRCSGVHTPSTRQH